MKKIILIAALALGAAFAAAAQMEHFARGIVVDTGQRPLQMRPSAQRTSFYSEFIHLSSTKKQTAPIAGAYLSLIWCKLTNKKRFTSHPLRRIKEMNLPAQNVF